MRAAVLHPHLTGTPSARHPSDALAEASSLTRALDELDLVLAEVVPVPKPQPGTLFGPGKLDELKARLKADDIGLAIVDGPLTPVQQRNLERAWQVKILDRTGLILEIFGDRAQTREGVLQVDLAHLTYQKTRLVRSWTHLERQRGGLGFVGGPGETQIEADRRALTERINQIRRQLSKVVKTRTLHRAARKKVPFPIVALVGYTNAGKSTLFNRLTGAGALAEDMLFATLDPKMRAITLPAGEQVIMSDTVGFISDLPTQLVAAFRATLEEVQDADLILHVRDIAHPETGTQANEVYRILADLDIDVETDPRIVEVLNKIDLLDEESLARVMRRADRAVAQVPISAETGQGLEQLGPAIADAIGEQRHPATVHVPFADGRARAWLFEQNLVSGETSVETGFELSVSWTVRQEKEFEALRLKV